MGKAERVKRRRELRSQQAIEVRKSKFIVHYIKAKYPVIYAGANEFYNIIDKHYPEKRDLTKTIEYRAWELNTTREAGQLNTKSLTSKATVKPTGMSNFELRIPLLDLTKATDEGTAGPAIHEETLDEGTASPAIHEETLDEGTAGPAIHEETLDEGTAGPAIHEETPDEVTDDLDLLGEIVVETIGFDQFASSSILDEIEPGVLTQLCEELEADPELKEIFEDIEIEGLDIEY